jgi:hypothetical protein
MKLINLIVPAAMIAAIALFAPHADAQTMGEYATTTAGVGSGASSIGTTISNTVASDNAGVGGGDTRTWGASSLGGSFEERAGAVSSSGAGADFDSRAESMTGGSGSESRWPTASHFSTSESANRFGDSGDGASGRFPASDNRFTERQDLSASSSDRFPQSQFNDNRMGLDTQFSSSSGLDNGHSSN